jgi:hypothetical protein
VSDDIRYYCGIHKVKVVTQSDGYWIVEALEEFEDTLNGAKVTVKVGEQRIVPPRSVHKRKNLPPPVKEHEYELKMEKKVKRLVAKAKKKPAKKRSN